MSEEDLDASNGATSRRVVQRRVTAPVCRIDSLLRFVFSKSLTQASEARSAAQWSGVRWSRSASEALAPAWSNSDADSEASTRTARWMGVRPASQRRRHPPQI